jgi:hypothetical protein
VAAWYPEIEQQKTTRSLSILRWFENHFTRDWKNYLKIEPEVPYKLDFISNRFDRGNDITHETLLRKAQENQDDLFLDHYRGEEKIVLILNKCAVPLAYVNRCIVINMLFDTQDAITWYHRAKLRKLYFEREPGVFVIKQDHPDFCSDKRSVLAKQYNNVKEVRMDPQEFWNQYIVNDASSKIFCSLDTVTCHPSNHQQPQLSFSVESFRDSDVLYRALLNLYRSIGICVPDQSLLNDICKFYVKVNQ